MATATILSVLLLVLVLALATVAAVAGSALSRHTPPAAARRWLDDSGSLVPTPTCDEQGLTYFPNDCIRECQLMDLQLDMETSRNVNQVTKCFCDDGTPLCTDEPQCSDLLVFPGTAEENCQTLCGPDATVEVVDEVQFAGDSAAANKDLTHLMVACVCDAVVRCGTDFVLFSDLAFLSACSSSRGDGALGIDSAEECEAYCTGLGFLESTYGNGACLCSMDSSDAAQTAVACDDNNANSNGRPQSNDCFAQVGVSQIDCPTPTPTEAPGSAASGKKFFATLSAMVIVAATVTLWMT